MIREGTAVLVAGSVKVHDSNIVDGAAIAVSYVANNSPLLADQIDTGAPPHVKGFVISALNADGSVDTDTSGPVKYQYDDGT